MKMRQAVPSGMACFNKRKNRGKRSEPESEPALNEAVADTRSAWRLLPDYPDRGSPADASRRIQKRGVYLFYGCILYGGFGHLCDRTCEI